jgi:Lanthionine synthetase C-like protein
VTASGYLDEELLLAGAELIWDAGPPDSDEKGAGLCHGTAGNGYAFLKTFERTDDERWLERARAFAMHALAQAEHLPVRYSLFTGGIGAALFAADCIDAHARFPIVDGLDDS